MSDQLVLSAETRDRGGKGASRELRRNGRVPAVVYGGKEEPLMIHVEEKLLMKQLMTGHFMNSVVMIEVDGKQVRTLPKDVAFHPVKDRPIHADFLRISKDAKVQVAVPVLFVNEDASPGLKRGGVLNIVRHELELVCDADKIHEPAVQLGCRLPADDEAVDARVSRERRVAAHDVHVVARVPAEQRIRRLRPLPGPAVVPDVVVRQYRDGVRGTRRPGLGQ